MENPTNGLPSCWLETRPKELDITSKFKFKDNRMEILRTKVQNHMGFKFRKNVSLSCVPNGV